MTDTRYSGCACTDIQYSTLGGQGATGTTKSFLTLLFFLQRDYLRTIRGGILQKGVLIFDTP